MKYCKNCGQQIGYNIKFCTNCGNICQSFSVPPIPPPPVHLNPPTNYPPPNYQISPPPPPLYPPPPPPIYVFAPPVPPGRGKAITAMILGIIGLLMCLILFYEMLALIAGIALGIVSICLGAGSHSANKNVGAPRSAMATAGIVLGIITLVIAALLFLVFLAYDPYYYYVPEYHNLIL